MTRWTRAGFMALAALSAVAVFDVAPAAADAAPSVSPFAGSWSGTWSVTDSEDAEFEGVGTFDWTIANAGRITGTVEGSTAESGGTVVGHVGADGKLKFVGYAPADVPTDGNGVPWQGTAMIDGEGKLFVSVTRMDDSTRSLVAILERD